MVNKVNGQPAAKYPTIEIPLPDNRATGLRLRQLGTTDVLYWSIHELELWERVP